jgi:hypothetical protein
MRIGELEVRIRALAAANAQLMREMAETAETGRSRDESACGRDVGRDDDRSFAPLPRAGGGGPALAIAG